MEKIPFQLTFSSTSGKEKSYIGLYCCVLVHKSLWNDLFWSKPRFLREILMKKNKKVPLYYLKSLKTINNLQETAQHKYMHTILYLHCHRRFANNLPLSLLFTDWKLTLVWQSSTLCGKILFLSFPCNSASFPQPLTSCEEQVWFVDQHWEPLFSNKALKLKHVLNPDHFWVLAVVNSTQAAEQLKSVPSIKLDKVTALKHEGLLCLSYSCRGAQISP